MKPADIQRRFGVWRDRHARPAWKPRTVLQVDSEDNVPHMFGDVGCGHITQCPDHPSVLAFGWACG